MSIVLGLLDTPLYKISTKYWILFLREKVFEFILAIVKDILVEKVPPFNSGT